MEAKNSIRVHYAAAENEAMFLELMGALRDYKEMKTQITFFMAVSHPPMPLEKAVEQADILGKRMVTAREYGFESGINILSTLGHHEENLDNSLKGDFMPMTNIEGHLCMGSFCPNDEKFRGHIEKLYKLIVAADPDYIWIDDDVRFFHGPIGAGCYCDNCLDIFEQEYGVKYTRAELKAAFADKDAKGELDLNLNWLQHNRNTLNKLFTLIEKVVTENSKRVIGLGFMTGERYYEGYGFAEIAEILRGKVNRPVWWRPGGGAYSDEPLYALIHKSHEIGRQTSLLPQYVDIIQSEIECFPYQILKKSPSAIALEAASHIAGGCTGAAYNIICPMNTGETPKDFVPMFDKLAKVQPFCDMLVNAFGRIPPTGVYTGWTTDLWAVKGDPGNYAREILELGLPAAYNPDYACATVLGGDSVKAMKPSMIEKTLSGGVYLDARALNCLNSLGYGELTGFEAKGFITKDCIESSVAHPLNEGIPAGSERNCYQAFYHGDAAIIEPTNSKAEILSYMKDYSENVISACSWGVFENSIGGRICIAGYYPWGFVQSRTKFRQLNNIFGYLSRNTLPSMSGSYARLYNWTRILDNGDLATAVINGSLETLKDTVILLKTNSVRCVAYDMNCEKMECKLVLDKCRDGYNAFSIPVIQPWQMVFIRNL
ncbi:MAG: hypothetical protein FWF15_01350 [Oscillospiraceae bacterium]|nr:hypothetical protein [Oscillospiraceae bacterium]